MPAGDFAPVAPTRDEAVHRTPVRHVDRLGYDYELIRADAGLVVAVASMRRR